MFSDVGVELWYQSLNLSDEAQALIHQIRTSQPVRAVGGYQSNVSGRYPSRKMGATIQFESHKNELAFIHEYEYDDDVLEYYDQPSTIKLSYDSAMGRRLGVLHTPDFFVLRARSAGWEECKTEEQLIKLTLKNPKRYFYDANGNWRCPPAETYAESLGLHYRIRSSKEIDWTYQRNIEFLEDYYRNESVNVTNEARTLLQALVTREPGISLKELLVQTKETASRDDVFMLIVTAELYINLNEALLVEQDYVRVYPDRETGVAYKNLMHVSAQGHLFASPFVDLKPETNLQWDNAIWKILNIGETSIGIIGEDNEFSEVPLMLFERLVREGRITEISDAAPNTHPDVKRRLEQADQRTLQEANRRSEVVLAYQQGNLLPENIKVSLRTVRYWAAQYCSAKESYGNGFVGLLPHKRNGNTKDRLPLQTRELMARFIEDNYETYKQKKKSIVYALYRRACEQAGVMAASYKTFTKAISLRPRYTQTLKRQGRKAAYKDKEFYWELTLTTPRHGERPLHIVHVDHTELDIELVCSLTGQNLGRAWATFLTDAFSRRMAVYLTYDSPTYRSCMMILRECVRRFSRLPQIIVVDGGSDFNSVYFETLLARYECTKKTRPFAEGRFGSVCERLFGTANTQFIHNLQGNTQIMRNVRQVTKSNSPRENAVWTLEKLYQYMCIWAYEVYDTNEHPALGQSPRNAYTAGIINTGTRAHRLMRYDEEFRILTLPTTSKSTAKVCPPRGIKVNSIYYWSDAFRHPEIAGRQVSVRYDPFDAGCCFAFVRGQWTECYSEHYAAFRNRSEREIRLATEELRKRQKRHSKQLQITAAKLAHFLESVESEEILLKQRMTDRESRNIVASAAIGLLPQGNAISDNNRDATNAAPEKCEQVDTIKKSEKLETYGEF